MMFVEYILDDEQHYESDEDRMDTHLTPPA